MRPSTEFLFRDRDLIVRFDPLYKRWRVSRRQAPHLPTANFKIKRDAENYARRKARREGVAFETWDSHGQVQRRVSYH